MKNFIFKTKAEIVLSNEPAFFDDDGTPFCGLKEFEIIKNSKFSAPIYIFDNHNFALLPFFETTKKYNKQFEIVHIDAHRDNAIFQHSYPKQITKNNLNWCLEKTRISDYLDLATKTNLIGKIHNITQSWEFENFKLPQNDFILNLDIDIFGPDGEMVETELKTKVIKKAMQKAKTICIATSPGFIDQNIAKEKILELLYK